MYTLSEELVPAYDAVAIEKINGPVHLIGLYGKEGCLGAKNGAAHEAILSHFFMLRVTNVPSLHEFCNLYFFKY